MPGCRGRGGGLGLGLGAGLFRAAAGGVEGGGGAQFFEHGGPAVEELGEDLARHALAAFLGLQLGKSLVFGGLPGRGETRGGNGEALFGAQQDFEMPQALLFGFLREALDFDAEVFAFGFLRFGFVAKFLQGFGEGGNLADLVAFFGAEVAPGERNLHAEIQGEEEARVETEGEGVKEPVGDGRHGRRFVWEIGTGGRPSDRLTKRNLRESLGLMKRVLSVLLLIPFLCTQAWAIRGGPYDDIAYRDIGALAGIYGIALYGLNDPQTGLDPTVQEQTLTKNYPSTGSEVSTTAILNLNLPPQGIADGKILLFYKGLMYVGYAKGIVLRKSLKLLLLSELSHYTILSGATYTKTTGTQVTGLVQQGTQAAVAPANPGAGGGGQNQNGLQATPIAVLGSMMTGRIDLNLSLDYFSGLLSVSGFANYVMVQGEPDASGAYASWSVMRDFASVVIDSRTTETGATETTTQTTAPDAEALRQFANSAVFLKLEAEGYRLTDGLAAGTADDYLVPAAETFFQIGGGGILRPTGGVGGGVGGGGGGGGVGGAGGAGGLGGGGVGGGGGALGGALGGGGPIPGGVGGGAAPAPAPAVR